VCASLYLVRLLHDLFQVLPLSVENLISDPNCVMKDSPGQVLVTRIYGLTK
jgi:hypothetical protein